MASLKLYTETKGIPEIFFPSIIKQPSYFNFTELIEEADYVVIPIHWEVIYDYTLEEFKNANFKEEDLGELKRRVNLIIENANRNNKPLIIFFYRDSLNNLPIKNAIVFRTSLLKSKQKKTEFALAANKGDIQIESGLLSNSRWLKKTKKPSVGFRGASAPFNLPVISSIKEEINSLAMKFSVPFRLSTGWEEGYAIRRKAMIYLKNNSHIDTDFSILHDGAVTKDGNHSNRELFINNLMNNQYNLCVKGWGNYSYRFYETISAGRIPIFVNTDCVLPFDFIIDWKKYCVWVEGKDLHKIDQILLDFHNSHNETEFIELQINIRRIWEDWVSDKGYLEKFHLHFPVRS